MNLKSPFLKFRLFALSTLFFASAAFSHEEYGAETNHDLPEGLHVGDNATYVEAHNLDRSSVGSKTLLKVLKL